MARNKDKTHIKVRITKNLRFRVTIKEGDDGSPYNFTVGGEQWQAGRWREHERAILHICKSIVADLTATLKFITHLRN